MKGRTLDISCRMLHQQQYLHKHTIHCETRLDDAVHLLQLVQEEAYSAVHPSVRLHAAMPNY